MFAYWLNVAMRIVYSEIMLLIEGYIRLGGRDFLQTHSSRVTTILKEFVGEVRIKGGKKNLLSCLLFNLPCF